MPLEYFNFIYLLVVYLFCCIHKIYSCLTPLAANGRVQPMSECQPYLELVRRFQGTELPIRVRTFLQLSHSHVENGQDYVCCGPVIDLEAKDGAITLNNFRQSCGACISKRISFGKETTLGRYPWLVLLEYDSEWEKFQCGGTIITQRYVLTAAHCAVHTRSQLVGVRLGEHNILTNPDCEEDIMGELHCLFNVQDIPIEKIIVHPQYSKIKFEHDIALLRLSRVIKFHKSIQPICVPNFHEEFEPDGTNDGIISGWGATEKGTKSNILVAAEVSLHNMSLCQGTYRRRQLESNYQICAAGDNNIHSCNGDSGGPLFFKKQEDKCFYIQVGIISLGSQTCSKNSRHLPSVFTNIAGHLDWIEDSIEM